MTTVAQTTEIVKFNNQELLTLKVGEIIYTAIRPIVEGMGLDWTTQAKKIRNNAEKFNCRDMPTVAQDGKIREMLCMPIKKLNGWLFSINPEKVKPEIKDDVIAYQEECFEALYNYWHKGEAINPRRLSTVKDRNGLVKLVNWAVKQLNIDYSEACNMVNYRFNTKNFAELTCEQVEHACEYVQGLILEYGKSYQPIAQPQVMALPPAQNVSQGKFVGAFDEYGRMAMRQMHDDEFVTTMFDLPKLIQSDTETNLAVLSEINAAVSNRIAFLATTLHTYKRVGAA